MTSSDSVTIGQGIDGAIDDVMIFDRALDTDEVQQIYDNGLDGKSSSAYFYTLTPDSPCIDVGYNDVVDWDYDIDGDDRIIDGDDNQVDDVDMGTASAPGADEPHTGPVVGAGGGFAGRGGGVPCGGRGGGRGAEELASGGVGAHGVSPEF